MDGDRHRALGRRRAHELAAAAEPHNRSAGARRRDSFDDICPGEGGDHRRGRAAQQLDRRRELHQAAAVDHADPLGQSGGVLEGMGDQQRRQFKTPQLVGELVTHLLAGDRIERTERLVEQQDARLTGQRTSQRNALALATGKLPGPRQGEVSDTQALEQVRPVALAGKAHVCRDRQVREQTVVLRQVPDAASLSRQTDVLGSVQPDLAAKGDPSLARALQAGDRA